MSQCTTPVFISTEEVVCITVSVDVSIDYAEWQPQFELCTVIYEFTEVKFNYGPTFSAMRLNDGIRKCDGAIFDRPPTGPDPPTRSIFAGLTRRPADPRKICKLYAGRPARPARQSADTLGWIDWSFQASAEVRVDSRVTCIFLWVGYYRHPLTAALLGAAAKRDFLSSLR